MKKRLLFLLSMGLVASLSIVLLSLHRESVLAKNFKAPHPLTEINQKAKNVRNGKSDETSAYVSEILKVAGFETELPGFTSGASASFTERIASAENDYRQGKAAGINEVQVARTVNDLAVQLHLPEYSKTNAYEVRRLRFMLMPNFPEVIGRSTQAQQPIDKGTKFDSEMAPAEAVFILMMMLQQKIYNPEFQVTTLERASYWNDLHSRRPGEGPSPNLPANRTAETLAALHAAGDSMAITDLMSFSDRTLNKLGIEGGEK